MANEVRITVGADTKQADRAVKGFKQRLEGISGKAKIAGASLSVMGAGGILAIKGFANAALEQEKALATLSAVMDNAGESFGDMEKEIMSTTAALQRKTNFGDEAQIRALAKLVPVLGSTELALKALPAAMDVASLTGKDLGSVIDTMGPALAGVTNRIRGTALEFTDAMTPMERINMVLADLGGAAEANADPFIQMGNAIGDVKESIGAQLLPIITPLITKIQSFAERLQTLNPQVVKIGALVLAAATAFAVIGGPILLLIGFLPAMAAGFAMVSAAALPITLIVIGIAAAIAAAIVIWKNWDKIVNFFGATIKAVGDTFSHWKDLVTKGVNAVWNVITTVFRAIQAAYETNWSWILPGGALINAFKALNEKVREVVDAIMSKWNEFKNVIGDFMFIISEKLEQPMQNARDTFLNVWNAIVNGIQSAIEKIKGFIDGFINKIQSLINLWKDSPLAKGLGALGGVVSGAFGAFKGFMGQETGLAHGGFIGGPEGAPRLAMVHGGELVLNRAQQAAVGNTFNITVNGNVDDPAAFAREIAREIDRELGRAAHRDEQVRSI